MKKFVLILIAISMANLQAGHLLMAEDEKRDINLKPVEPKAETQDRPVVLNVKKGSPADLAGIIVGDLIISVNNEPVTSKGHFLEVLKKGKIKKKVVSLGIIRDEVSQDLTAEFKEPTERLGVDIGDYFVITRKRAQPATIIQRKGDFGVGVNGKASPYGIAKFNVRIDNFSEAPLKIKLNSDCITASTNNIPLTRLTPEDVVDMTHPELAKLKDVLPGQRRRLSAHKRKLLKKRGQELKMLKVLDLKDCVVPPKAFILGSLYYNNTTQAYPIDLEIKVGDQVFNFSFEEEAE